MSFMTLQSWLEESNGKAADIRCKIVSNFIYYFLYRMSYLTLGYEKGTGHASSRRACWCLWGCLSFELNSNEVHTLPDLFKSDLYGYQTFNSSLLTNHHVLFTTCHRCASLRWFGSYLPSIVTSWIVLR